MCPVEGLVGLGLDAYVDLSDWPTTKKKKKKKHPEAVESVSSMLITSEKLEICFSDSIFLRRNIGKQSQMKLRNSEKFRKKTEIDRQTERRSKI